MNVQQCRVLLRRLESEEAEKLQAQAAQRQREADALAAAKVAEESRLIREWEEEQKRCRFRIVVPDGLDISEFNGHGRRYIDHRGKVVVGSSKVICATENGQRVAYLQTWHDFLTLTMNPQNGEAWRRVNGDAIIRIAPFTKQPLPGMPTR
jgi:hypothetical protein